LSITVFTTGGHRRTNKSSHDDHRKDVQQDEDKTHGGTIQKATGPQVQNEGNSFPPSRRVTALTAGDHHKLRIMENRIITRHETAKIAAVWQFVLPQATLSGREDIEQVAEIALQSRQIVTRQEKQFLVEVCCGAATMVRSNLTEAIVAHSSGPAMAIVLHEDKRCSASLTFRL